MTRDAKESLFGLAVGSFRSLEEQTYGTWGSSFTVSNVKRLMEVKC